MAKCGLVGTELLKAGQLGGLEGLFPAVLERAFLAAQHAAPLRRKLREARIDDADEAAAKGVLSAAERETLRQAEDLLDQVVAVDDFAPADLSTLAAAKPSAL